MSDGVFDFLGLGITVALCGVGLFMFIQTSNTLINSEYRYTTDKSVQGSGDDFLGFGTDISGIGVEVINGEPELVVKGASVTFTGVIRDSYHPSKARVLFYDTSSHSSPDYVLEYPSNYSPFTKVSDLISAMSGKVTASDMNSDYYLYEYNPNSSYVVDGEQTGSYTFKIRR